MRRYPIPILILSVILSPRCKVYATQLERYQFELVFGDLYWFQSNTPGIQHQTGIVGIQGQPFLSFFNFYNLAYKKDKKSKLSLSPAIFLSKQLFNVQTKLGFSTVLIKANAEYAIAKVRVFTKCSYVFSISSQCLAGLQLRWNRNHWPGFGLASGKNFLLSYRYKISYISAEVEALLKDRAALSAVNFRINYQTELTKTSLTQTVISPLSKKQQVPSMNILLKWGVSLDGAIQLQRHRDICRMNNRDKDILARKNWRC